MWADSVPLHPGPPLRIVIADDQASVREGLVLLLGGLSGIDVVDAADDGKQALALVAEHKPDAILLDVHMPVLDRIAAIRRLTAEHLGRSPSGVPTGGVAPVESPSFEGIQRVFAGRRSGTMLM